MKNKVSEEPAIRAAEKQAPAGDLSQPKKETAMPQAQMAPQMGHGVDTPSPDKPDTEEEKARASALSTVPSGAERENQGQPAVVPAEAGKLSDTMPAKGGIMSKTEWLANVRLLWAAGNKNEAVASLKRFLTAYPHYPHAEIIKQLPDDFDPAKYISEF